MASTDDLSLLMPSLRRKALSSAADTTAVHEPLVLPKLQPQAAVCEPSRPATDSHDVEQLKDEVLAGYLQRSRERLASKLRTGRAPSNRQFSIRLRPVILPVPAAQEEPASPKPQEQNIVHDAEPQPQSVTRPTPQAQLQQTACPTPATNLIGRTPVEGVPERWLPAPQQKCQTPATALVGRTPMEGVPERWTAPRAAMQNRPATPAPALPTPMEGVPEGRTVLVVHKMPLARRLEQQHQRQRSVDSPIEGVVQQGARATTSDGRPAALGEFTFAAAMAEPQHQQGAEAAARTGEAGQMPAQTRWPSAAELSSGEDELEDDGFDYGGNDEPSVIKHPREAAGASPPPQLDGLEAAVPCGASLHARLMQGTSPGGGAGPADRAVQTGISQHGSPHDPAEQQEVDGMDYRDDGFDAGGFDYDDYDSDHEQEGVEAAAPQDQGDEPVVEPPETSAHAAQRQQRRRTTNFGARLRNELKRKSLGADPKTGRREVAPGIRRSTRQKQSPLQWWRGETKNFSRQEHRTMPTVKNVVHKSPTTPWRTVSDIYGRHKKRQRHQQQQSDEQENQDS
ncbi:hypothetical protein N2152v2_006184 [Parachlorella kessleri]